MPCTQAANNSIVFLADSILEPKDPFQYHPCADSPTDFMSIYFPFLSLLFRGGKLYKNGFFAFPFAYDSYINVEVPTKDTQN